MEQQKIIIGLVIGLIIGAVIMILMAKGVIPGGGFMCPKLPVK